MNLPTAFPDLSGLVRLFYTFQNELATFVPISAPDLPPVPRRLLAHDEHMTITVESIHGSAVDVHVLASHTTDGAYCRKIYLTRQEDDAPVLFGIIRVNLSLLDEPVRRDILSQRIPLGRVLIRHNVLRKVELKELFKITPGIELARLLECEGTIYGRTGWIHLNDQPAVELLEIVPAEIRPTAGTSRKKEKPARSSAAISPQLPGLRERLKDWCDEPHASKQIAICLGLMTDETCQSLAADDPFWTDDPLGDMLFGALDQLVAAGAVQTKEMDDDSEQFRWNPFFVGSWEKDKT